MIQPLMPGRKITNTESPDPIVFSDEELLGFGYKGDNENKILYKGEVYDASRIEYEIWKNRNNRDWLNKVLERYKVVAEIHDHQKCPNGILKVLNSQKINVKDPEQNPILIFLFRMLGTRQRIYLDMLGLNFSKASIYGLSDFAEQKIAATIKKRKEILASEKVKKRVKRVR